MKQCQADDMKLVHHVRGDLKFLGCFFPFHHKILRSYILSPDCREQPTICMSDRPEAETCNGAENKLVNECC